MGALVTSRWGARGVSWALGCFVGGALGLAGWAWGLDSHVDDSVRMERSTATIMGVGGELPACSLVEVLPPKVMADFGKPTGLDFIRLEIDSCSGATALAGGIWPYAFDDSWKGRRPLEIAISHRGGVFECSMLWTYKGHSSGPVDFIATWRIVKLQGERCELVSKR